MKTLLLSEVFPPMTGGSGRWFWEVYRRLPREAFLVAAAEHPSQKAFDAAGDLRVERLPWRFSTWGVGSLAGAVAYSRTALRLRRLAAAEGVDRVHCGKCLPEGLLGWILKRWCRLPYVCYVHGEELNLATTSRELTWLTRRVLHRADFLIANSRNTCRLLREAWALPEDRVRLLHPGVDTQRFHPAAKDVAARDRLGWGDRPVVLTVSRLQKRKGHDQMIRALPLARKEIPDILYTIVGGGEERPNLEALTAALGMGRHVQFLGELPDDRMVRCYQQCDLFVLANRQVGHDIEGFGMVLLEAQACGKPVVAGISGGTAETMRIPETGRVVDCDSPEALAAVVVELLRDRQRLTGMGAAARDWAVAEFDWAAQARRAMALFQSQARPHKPAMVRESA
jgi:phosphatidylinositol alpha-1,6-mannosyltransferase